MSKRRWYHYQQGDTPLLLEEPQLDGAPDDWEEQLRTDAPKPENGQGGAQARYGTVYTASDDAAPHSPAVPGTKRRRSLSYRAGNFVLLMFGWASAIVEVGLLFILATAQDPVSPLWAVLLVASMSVVAVALMAKVTIQINK